MDVAGFVVVDLPLSPLLHHLLLPLLGLLLHPQLGVIVNKLPLIQDLCPRFPLLFRHLPLVLDKFIQEIILKRMRWTVFVASRQFPKNDDGERPLFP